MVDNSVSDLPDEALTNAHPDDDRSALSSDSGQLADYSADAVQEISQDPDETGYRFSRKLTVLSDPRGVHSSAVGALRNHLSQQHLRLGRRSLAVCSVGGDTHRSQLSANLAIASAQAGASTVLIDANFREPELDQFFVPPQSQLGLGDYLNGDVDDIGDVLRTDVLENLTLIHVGSRPADPQALLAGERFEQLMTALMRNFDFTIVDCPPARQSADARRIASVVRYALIVGERDVTFVDDVQQLIDELQSDRVSVIGTFLNVP